MNHALELHDSRVARVHGTGDRLSIEFSEAYIHASEGTPGVSPGDGYLQRGTLVFVGASWSNLSSGLSGAISDGRIEINGKEISLIPVPSEFNGEVRADLVFASGDRLGVVARGMACSVQGEARWMEAYAG